MDSEVEELSEDLEEEEGDEIEVNLNFKPEYQMNLKNSPSSKKDNLPKLESGDAKERIKLLFELTSELYNSDEEQINEKLSNELNEFCKVHHPNHFIETFLANFHDGKIKDCF